MDAFTDTCGDRGNALAFIHTPFERCLFLLVQEVIVYDVFPANSDATSKSASMFVFCSSCDTLTLMCLQMFGVDKKIYATHKCRIIKLG